MKRKKVLGLTKANNIAWYAREALPLEQGQIRFHELHPDLKRTETHRQRAAKHIVFDIIRNITPERADMLAIRHLTQER